MSGPPVRQSERLTNQGRTLCYQKYHSRGEKEYRSNTAGEKQTEVIRSRLSSSGLDSTFQSVGSEAVPETPINTTLVEDPSVVNEISDLMNKMELDDKEYKKLVCKLKSIKCNIVDHLDEYPASDITGLNDIDRNLSKIEKLRSDYREYFLEIMEYLNDPDEEIQKIKEGFESQKDAVLVKIKDYIGENGKIRAHIHEGEKTYRMNEDYAVERREKDVIAQKIRTTNFLLDEIKRMITELTLEYSKSEVEEEVSDEEVIRRNRDMSENTTKADKLSTKFQQFLQTIPETYPNFNGVVEGTKKSYDQLIKEKGFYENFVKLQIQEREILKEKSFKTSYLNIQLSKFKGYHSDLDIFSFQAEFEKLYVRNTPSKMLPD